MFSEGQTARTAAKAKYDGEMAARKSSLETEWGQAYQTKMQQAISAAAYYDDTLKLGGALKKEAETSLAHMPVSAKLFAALAANLAEDGKLTGKSFGSDALASPAEAMQKINALKADPAFTKRYTNIRDPGHADALNQMKALYEQAYPSKAA